MTGFGKPQWAKGRRDKDDSERRQQRRKDAADVGKKVAKGLKKLFTP